MNRSLSIESTPQIDFENTLDEDVDETSRKRYVGYSKRNFTDLFNIPDYNNINTVAAQTTKVTLELMKMRLMRCLRKRGKGKIIKNVRRQNQNQNHSST